MSEPRRELTVTIGLPGSGKTTWALEQIASRPPGQVVRVNRDSLRLMLHGGLRLDPDGEGLHPATEEQVTAVQRAAISALFGLGIRRVIVDDTNMNPVHLDQWYELTRTLGVGFGVKSFLDVPVKTCVERDAQRAATVGEQVICRMDERFGRQARTWYELVRAGVGMHLPAIEKKG